LRTGALSLAAAACLALSGAPSAQPAQTLLEAYERVASIVNYSTGYVGEALIACTAANAMTEEQAEARFQSYRQRNSGLTERVEAWSADAERRLREQGQERDATRVSQDAGMNALAGASARAQEAIAKARDPRAACALVVAALDAGTFDLARNAELIGLLGR
jgi:hypothetical protein